MDNTTELEGFLPPESMRGDVPVPKIHGIPAIICRARNDLFECYEWMARMAIALYDPEVILLSEECEAFGQAVLKAAKHLKTIALQHGDISVSHEAYVLAAHKPSTMLVNSPQEKQVLHLLGWGTVVVTGEPRHDSLVQPYNQDEMKKDLAIKPDEKLVVFFSQSHGLTSEENLKVKKALELIHDDLEGSGVLLVKLHPCEKHTPYRGLYTTSTDTTNLLKACDVAITCWSTVALEAIAMNKPTVLFRFDPGWYTPAGLTDENTFFCKQPEYSASTVRGCLNKPEAQHEARKAITKKKLPLLGKGVGNVLKVIRDEG